MAIDWKAIDEANHSWRHHSASGVADALKKAAEQCRKQLEQVTDPESRVVLESLLEMVLVAGKAGEHAARDASHASAYASEMIRCR